MSNIKERLEAKRAEEAAKRQSLIARECFKAGHDSLASLLVEAYTALEKISDPRKRDHREPDAQTEVYCLMHIAAELIAKIDKEIP